MLVEPGQPAPDFTLLDQHGQSHRLSDYRGKWVVLYFYPKDDTPGCTREASSFRDHLAELAGKDAVVLGISADTVQSHERFAEKYSLPFTLLSDPEHLAIEPYGVWTEKSGYGKKTMGIERTTFLVNPEGKIEKVWRKVRVEGHSEEVMSAIA